MNRNEDKKQTMTGAALPGTGRRGRRADGLLAEEAAAEYLAGQGYALLARNYATRFGEIDLILRKGDLLVFAEVKYRKSSHLQHPLEAVDRRKMRRIACTALIWLERNGYPADTRCRFDVVGICGQTITHVKGAFGAEGLPREES